MSKETALTEQEERWGEKAYTPIQGHFLSLLQSLKEKRESYLKEPDRDEKLLRLLDKGLYSAYRDCVDSGLGKEAKAVLSGSGRDK